MINMQVEDYMNYEWMNEWMKGLFLLSHTTFISEKNHDKERQWLHVNELNDTRYWLTVSEFD